MSGRERKRGREPDDLSLPLSKRINNLHLNNNGGATSSSNHNGDHHLQQHLPQQQPQPLEVYNPDLTERENPHYFQKNKVLYELREERERRAHP